MTTRPPLGRIARRRIPVRVTEDLWTEIAVAHGKECKIRGDNYSLNDYLCDSLRYALDLPAYMLAHGQAWYDAELDTADKALIRQGCLDLKGALVNPMHARLIPFMLAASPVAKQAEESGLLEKLRLAPLDALMCVQYHLLAHARKPAQEAVGEEKAS
jgi:hypothetical protein